MNTPLKSAPFSWYENPRHVADRLRIQAGASPRPPQGGHRCKPQPQHAPMPFAERLALQKRDER